jgi:hypothetical protein
VPERVRLRRTKGWRKPPGAVVVTRPTRWGNPFKVGADFEGKPLTADVAVGLYRTALEEGRLRFTIDDVRRELRGKDLACWCPIGATCHAEVLMEFANG